MLLLYDSPESGNCYKARLLLAQLGLPFERRRVDTKQRTGREDVLGGKNPALRVPVLRLDDGRHLAESNLSRFPAVEAWIARVASQPGHVPIDA